MGGPSKADVLAELARRRFDVYVRLTGRDEFGRMGRGPVFRWQRDLCRVLQDFAEDVVQARRPRLIVNKPPQHGGSYVVSERFPPWAMGYYHHRTGRGAKVMTMSYSATLARRLSVVARGNAVEAARLGIWPGMGRHPLASSDQPAAPQKWTELEWWPEQGGYYIAAGRGGGYTGSGFDVGVVDDAYKGREEADSPLVNEGLRTWWSGTFMSRAQPGAGVLYNGTRWALGDLAGWLEQQAEAGEGDPWNVVRFSACTTPDGEPCEPDHPEAVALCPERYTVEELLSRWKATTERDWLALYQQRPVPAGGVIFHDDWIRHYDADPRELPVDVRVVSMDATFGDADSADYVVIQVWGLRRDPLAFVMLHQVRARMSYTASRDALEQVVAAWKPDSVYVEGAANGNALVSDLQTRIPGIVTVPPRNVLNRKVQEAQAVTPLWRAGQVLLPTPGRCPWVKTFLSELLPFPRAQGGHDDQVDAMTLALSQLRALAFSDPHALVDALLGERAPAW